MSKDLLSAITAETLNMFSAGADLAKDATTTGYTTGTGLTGYSLKKPAVQIVPFLSGFRQRLGRVDAAQGSKRANWRAVTKVNAGSVAPSAAFGSAGTVLQTSEQDFSAAYKLLTFGDTVFKDAETFAKGFDSIRARSSTNTLLKLMEAEDIMLLGGQSFALAQPSAPTLVPATTGGTIGAVNVGVAVAARTLEGYYYNNGTTPFQTAASTPATTGSLTGTTNKIVASMSAAIPGAVVYDWYVGSAGGTLYYYTSTTTTVVTITSVPTVAQTPNYTVTPLMLAPALTAPASDTSGDVNSPDGFIATLTGNFQANSGGVLVPSGTGNATGATIIDNKGNGLTGINGTCAEIDALLFQLWWNARISPSVIMLNAIDHANVSNKIINSGGAYTIFRPDQLSERQKAIGGSFVATYMNKAVNGQPIALDSQPWMVQGTIAAMSERVPYPNSDINEVCEVETLEDYNHYEYGVSRGTGTTGGPRYDYDVRCNEAFKNYAPVAHGILQNVANA
jgi:hypothetical protein